jgi:hypothetical protein
MTAMREGHSGLPGNRLRHVREPERGDQYQVGITGP